MSKTETVTVKNRAALRAWLEANHANTSSIWLATYKKHHPNYLPWGEAVEELLCWGWVDGQVAALDADRVKRRVAAEINATRASRLRTRRALSA